LHPSHARRNTRTDSRGHGHFRAAWQSTIRPL
jgi:hypothetical protein